MKREERSVPVPRAMGAVSGRVAGGGPSPEGTSALNVRGEYPKARPGQVNHVDTWDREF